MKAIFILLWLTAAAYADDVATYAIVVGSNAGGPGQGELRYAEADAGRVGKLLTELGGYAPDQIDIVLHPTPDELRARLGKLADKLAADDKAGRPTRVLFYYSGHARATALDLGNKELPLSELRQRLFELPSKLTVVVLDACQSGAFSRVKGAEPAADFSFNSRQQLDATGVAVLASSSGSELSQESEQLKSSYFTHHLLVGLRGAGDTNGDGLVTVDEAYRYAYHQTLLATTETAVGANTSRSRSISRATAKCRSRSRARRPLTSSCRPRSRARRSSKTSARIPSSRRRTRRKGRPFASPSHRANIACSSVVGRRCRAAK